MPMTDPPTHLANFISGPLQVGDPISAGPLAVAPIFGPEPACEYRSFADARPNGTRIHELQDGASVRDVVIENPTPDRVLLFEGEEVLGAQQNRTFDVSVLVGPGAKVRVPVSCVEAGRWDGSRHDHDFEVAPQTASPRLRREKAEQAREQVAAGAEARADQGSVWNSISEVSAELGASSPTGALHDVYEDRRGTLQEICSRLPRQDGQVGSIAFIGGQMRVADLVSRPDTYAALHERLVQGYALDALAAPAAELEEIDAATARGVALLIADAPVGHRTPGAALGDEVRFPANGVTGSGLVFEEELLALSVFRG